ncbi:hypothetical protein Mapa_000225 [Marchantia paleacea]|nr:hypothetical protein Mapa_000225 [Marchantia paleacea]
MQWRPAGVSIRPGDDHHSVAGGEEGAGAFYCGDSFPVITTTPQLHACKHILEGVRGPMASATSRVMMVRPGVHIRADELATLSGDTDHALGHESYAFQEPSYFLPPFVRSSAGGACREEKNSRGNAVGGRDEEADVVRPRQRESAPLASTCVFQTSELNSQD